MYDMHTIGYTLCMEKNEYIDFEWDDRKADINERKHGITFDEAESAFSDPWARVIPDPDHSDQEERFILLGIDLMSRVLTVVHCERRGGSVIRIISARKATKREAQAYWRYRK